MCIRQLDARMRRHVHAEPMLKNIQTYATCSMLRRGDYEGHEERQRERERVALIVSWGMSSDSDSERD
jgi:hypothetical protein